MGFMDGFLSVISFRQLQNCLPSSPKGRYINKLRRLGGFPAQKDTFKATKGTPSEEMHCISSEVALQLRWLCVSPMKPIAKCNFAID